MIKKVLNLILIIVLIGIILNSYLKNNMIHGDFISDLCLILGTIIITSWLNEINNKDLLEKFSNILKDTNNNIKKVSDNFEKLGNSFSSLIPGEQKIKNEIKKVITNLNSISSEIQKSSYYIGERPRYIPTHGHRPGSDVWKKLVKSNEREMKKYKKRVKEHNKNQIKIYKKKVIPIPPPKF